MELNFFLSISTILWEHKPEVWWKVKKKERPSLRLKQCRKMYFWTTMHMLSTTFGHKMSFPC